MKRTVFIVCTVAILLAACAENHKVQPQSLEDAYRLMQAQLDSLSVDTTLSADDREAEEYNILAKVYQCHQEDSLGYEAFLGMVLYEQAAEEMVRMYQDASAMIRQDQKIKTKIEALSHLGDVQPGMAYKEVTGVDALTGDASSVSSFFDGNRPVLLDFWASWCPPCRREIKDHLVALAATGKVQIVGVAVWEKDVEDTRRAMEELGITWPVIYTGGREQSPTIGYGVVGIPTLVLISADGKVLSRGHSIEELGTF